MEGTRTSKPALGQQGGGGEEGRRYGAEEGS